MWVQGKGRERKGKGGNRRNRKGTEGKARERKGKEGKGKEWLEMGGEKKPLGMSELGCADGCGREMGAENGADGCGRRGCKGVAGNRRGKNKMQPTNPKWICSHSEQFSAIVYLNSLVYTYFPCYQSAVWSGQCRVWSVECKV